MVGNLPCARDAAGAKAETGFHELHSNCGVGDTDNKSLNECYIWHN